MMSANSSIRVALDMEGAKEHRQRANKVFEAEMVEKVKEYQQKKLHDIEETKKKIVAKQKKDEKRYAMEIKQRDDTIKLRNAKAEEKRIEAQQKKRNIIEDRERELKQKYDEIMEADAKFKAEVEARRIEHEEEMFVNDL